jgi:hypothetical protein
VILPGKSPDEWAGMVHVFDGEQFFMQQLSLLLRYVLGFFHPFDFSFTPPASANVVAPLGGG